MHRRDESGCVSECFQVSFSQPTAPPYPSVTHPAWLTQTVRLPPVSLPLGHSRRGQHGVGPPPPTDRGTFTEKPGQVQGLAHTQSLSSPGFPARWRPPLQDTAGLAMASQEQLVVTGCHSELLLPHGSAREKGSMCVCGRVATPPHPPCLSPSRESGCCLRPAGPSEVRTAVYHRCTAALLGGRDTRRFLSRHIKDTDAVEFCVSDELCWVVS